MCDCHYEDVSKSTWFYKKDIYGGYAARQVRILPYGDGNRGANYQRMMPMHRQVLDAKSGELVDHINGNKLDNRCSNLRIVNTQQNQHNRAKLLNNTSGYKGVQWRKDRNKWVAVIRVNTRLITLGTFKDIKDAAQAYNDAALRYHGEYARINKL